MIGAMTRGRRAATRTVALAWILTVLATAVPPRPPLPPDGTPVGAGWTDRLICLGCIAGVISASGTGSIIAVAAVLAELNPTIAAGCLYACSRWNA